LLRKGHDVKLLTIGLSLLLWPLLPAHAIDPGRAKGFLQAGAERVPIVEALAHFHDNAEGLLDRPRELRILLADREVPQEALAGIDFPMVGEMARDGRLRGLLIRVDPRDWDTLSITMFLPPIDPRDPRLCGTIRSAGPGPLKRMEMSRQRVWGEVEFPDSDGNPVADERSWACSIRFSAPLFHEPEVTSDFRGDEARRSPQARVLAKKAEALAGGDPDAAERLSTAAANRRSRASRPSFQGDLRSVARRSGRRLQESMAGDLRLVVRGDRAVAIFSDGTWTSLAQEGGAWKADD
jgi:hypothetical protein